MYARGTEGALIEFGELNSQILSELDTVYFSNDELIVFISRGGRLLEIDSLSLTRS